MTPNGAVSDAWLIRRDWDGCCRTVGRSLPSNEDEEVGRAIAKSVRISPAQLLIRALFTRTHTKV
jgi:hypothetical protein